MTYTPTEAEIDDCRKSGQEAALRSAGSPNDCPFRPLGADPADKPRLLMLARLWFTAFNQARAWQREQQAKA